MGFLKRFFMNVLQEDGAVAGGRSSFECLDEAALEAHLEIARYGDFLLTDAVRPSYDLKVTPRQGYRYDQYRDEDSGVIVPVLMAAASREVLFELFVESLEPLGTEVDVVLETSHDRQRGCHQDLYREHIDLPVLTSILWDYEDLLLDDGCTGIAVLNPSIPQEVQLDEHKLLIIYGEPLAPFEEILQARGVQRDDELQFITEAEHVHSSSEHLMRIFDQFKTELGIDELLNC
jgi:hypothetical protein